MVIEIIGRLISLYPHPPEPPAQQRREIVVFPIVQLFKLSELPFEISHTARHARQQNIALVIFNFNDYRFRSQTAPSFLR